MKGNKIPMDTENMECNEKKNLMNRINSLKSIAVKKLRASTDFSEYLDILNALKDDYLIVLSVRDTPGNPANPIIKKIHQLGFTKFSKEMWRMYIGVIDKGNVIFNEAGENPKDAVSFQNTGLNLSATSMAWENGNKSEIIINDIDFSVNKRGVNIVTYDLENNCLIDSICFDSHGKAPQGFVRKYINIYTSAEKNAEKRQAEMRQKMLDRPVVIFGGGLDAEKFIKMWGNTLNIRCALTTHQEEKGIFSFNDIRVPVGIYSKDKIHKNDFIVICCSENENNVKEAHNRLINDGFEYAKDYIISRLANALLEQKKIIVFAGYCQHSTLKDVLSKIKTVTDKYYMMDYYLGIQTVKESYVFQDFVFHVQICNILCYVPLFVKKAKTDLLFEKYIPENAVTFRFPYLPFRGLHPYKNSNLGTYNYLSIVKGERPWPFRYEEPYLDKFILEDKHSNQEIYDIVTSDDFISEAEIHKNLKLGFKMIEISQQNADCKILDYIKDNYKERPLFRDGLHYHNCLYFEVLRRMNRTLDLCKEEEINCMEKQYENDENFLFEYTEIPVLPCVAKVLGITYATEDHLYRVKCQDGTISLMTIKEWIFSYLDFTRSLYKIKQIFKLRT